MFRQAAGTTREPRVLPRSFIFGAKRRTAFAEATARLQVESYFGARELTIFFEAWLAEQRIPDRLGMTLSFPQVIGDQ